MARLAVAVCTCAACTACNIAGTWRAVDWTPADATPPFTFVTIDDNGRYTATSDRGSHKTTQTGRARWNGLSLRMAPDDGQEQVYSCRRAMGGQLIFGYRAEDVSAVATLRREAP